MTSAAKGHEGPPDQQDVVRKSSTQDHMRRSSFESPLAPIAQSFISQDGLHPTSPPSSLHDASPALSRVIDQIKALTDGSRSCTPYWSEFYLSRQDFEELQTRERRDEFEGKRLRYDYSTVDSTFALRMPTLETHEVFLGKSEYEIQCQLDRISSQDGIASTTSEFARGVVLRGSTTFYYPPPFSTAKKDTERSPDSAWAYRTVRIPSCIVEVANSQTTKDLTKLAHEYIWGTSAAVRTVVGFDFDYRPKKGATLSIWRPDLNDEGALAGITCEVVEIRNKDGQRNQDTNAGLCLSLEDFAFPRPSGTFDGLDRVSIFIPVSRLCDMLDLAEEQYRMGTGGEGTHDPVPLVATPVKTPEPALHRDPLRSRR